MEAARPTVSIVPSGQTPTEMATAKALQTFQVTDKRGRMITLKKPPLLAQFRLIDAVGGDTAGNQTYMSLATFLLHVVEIDGEQVFLPTKKSELEALIQRLDDDGMDAVSDGVIANFKVPKQAEERALLKK